MTDQEGLAIYHQRRTERLQAELEDATNKAESIKLSDDNGDPLLEMTQRLWKPLVAKAFELIQKHLTEASVGTTFAWPADIPLPPGYRRCNGQLLSAEEFWEYAGLPNVVGTVIGAGAYAKVPDLPGMIIKVTCADEPAPEAGGLLSCGKCDTPTDSYAKHVIECSAGTSSVEKQPDEWREVGPLLHHSVCGSIPFETLRAAIAETLKASRIRIHTVGGNVLEYYNTHETWGDCSEEIWQITCDCGARLKAHVIADAIQLAFMRGSKVEVLG